MTIIDYQLKKYLKEIKKKKLDSNKSVDYLTYLKKLNDRMDAERLKDSTSS